MREQRVQIECGGCRRCFTPPSIEVLVEAIRTAYVNPPRCPHCGTDEWFVRIPDKRAAIGRPS